MAGPTERPSSRGHEQHVAPPQRHWEVCTRNEEVKVHSRSKSKRRPVTLCDEIVLGKHNVEFTTGKLLTIKLYEVSALCQLSVVALHI